MPQFVWEQEEEIADRDESSGTSEDDHWVVELIL